ncbi:MAG: hypothetical protein DWQ36_07945 [Acidobacteria bacterium]|nr:MAG: hypothetical protein DWQ30_03880 [Acidobacteriota bacterium]REK08894.1 MAG: hypothetical protein DWQ36_07945 [Acidobacteriota bacterium]
MITKQPPSVRVLTPLLVLATLILAEAAAAQPVLPAVTKGAGIFSGPLDVCLMPAPPAPAVPIPYTAVVVESGGGFAKKGDKVKIKIRGEGLERIGSVELYQNGRKVTNIKAMLQRPRAGMRNSTERELTLTVVRVLPAPLETIRIRRRVSTAPVLFEHRIPVNAM